MGNGDKSFMKNLVTWALLGYVILELSKQQQAHTEDAPAFVTGGNFLMSGACSGPPTNTMVSHEVTPSWIAQLGQRSTLGCPGACGVGWL